MERSSADSADWPAHAAETVPWRQAQRGGSRDDRMLSEIVASIPPKIGHLNYLAPTEVVAACEHAQAQIIRLDAGAGPEFAPLAALLNRTEAVSSSKIELETASMNDYARAVGGVRSNASATSMVAAGAALSELVEQTGRRGVIDLDDILAAHRTLMHDDPVDGQHAGSLRTVQNWIGGSDFSPRGAIHVPPVPGRVGELMDDLVQFANRDDVPVLVQASIVHAQFESIHPFTDGNGRIGRALINAVLRRRGLTKHVIVPVASAMAADRQHYFDRVNAYRDGDLAPFITLVAHAAVVAAEESATTGRELRELPRQWRAAASPRAKSAAALLLDALVSEPVLTVERAQQITNAVPSSLYAALDRLESVGVIHEVTGRKRDRIYAATEVLAALDDLERRIGTRSLSERTGATE